MLYRKTTAHGQLRVRARSEQIAAAGVECVPKVELLGAGAGYAQPHCFQERSDLLGPPFNPEQVATLKDGRRPEGTPVGLDHLTPADLSVASHADESARREERALAAAHPRSPGSTSVRCGRH
jgi:hypothetical protein